MYRHAMNNSSGQLKKDCWADHDVRAAHSLKALPSISGAQSQVLCLFPLTTYNTKLHSSPL